MHSKIEIVNNSSNLSNSQIYDCINLLPEKYKNLDTKIYIFKSVFQYYKHHLKKLNIIHRITFTIYFFLKLLTFQIDIGFYSILTNEITVIETIPRLLVTIVLNIGKIKIHFNKNINKMNLLDINKYKPGWISFIVIDTLIHELTHATQNKENKLLNNNIKDIFTPWKHKTIEKETVEATINIMNNISDKVLEILNAEGISINHSLDPLDVNYKYNITI